MKCSLLSSLVGGTSIPPSRSVFTFGSVITFMGLFRSALFRDAPACKSRKAKDGFLNLPDRPGLGIEVKENDIAKLSYDKRMTYRQYRHADGSWKGW